MSTWKNWAFIIGAGSLALNLGGSTSQAEIKKFKLSRGTIQIDVPKEWQSAPDLYGIPLMLLGPEQAGRRPTLAVVPSGQPGQKITSEDLKANPDGFRIGREKWLKKYQGKALEFFPYQYEKLSNGSEVHTLGYRYEISSLKFTEKSYYVVCQGKLYILKSVLSDGHTSDAENSIQNTVRSLSCS